MRPVAVRTESQPSIVGPTLVEAAGIEAAVDVIRRVQTQAGEVGVLVVTASDQRAAALHAAFKRSSTDTPAPPIETCRDCARQLLRQLDPRYRRRLRVLDARAQRAVLRSVLGQMGLPATAAAVGHAILALSRIKTQACEAPFPGGEGRRTTVVSAFAPSQQLELLSLYERALLARGAVDLVDVVGRPLRALRHDPGSLAGWGHAERVVVIDHYDRLEPLELELVTLLARRTSGPVAIFDRPDPAAADRFRRDFPNAAGHQERAESPPVATTPELAAVSTRRRVLVASPTAEERLVSYQATDDLDEAGFIAGEITRLRDAGESLSRIAVVFRLQGASDVLQEALRRASIPVSRVGWYTDDPDTRLDVMAYLRLAADPDDDAAFARTLGRPARGVPAAAAASLAQLAGSLRLSLAATIPHAAMLSSLPARTRLALREFRGQIARWQQLTESCALADLVDRILRESGYLAWAEHRPGARFLSGEVERLRLAAAEFERLEGRDWMRFVHTVGEAAMDETVHLVSWTQLAGRDYAVIFLTGLEDGIIPAEHALADAAALAGDRSRFEALKGQARRCTVLTYALMRTMDGRLVVRDPSRFLMEMPAAQPVAS